MIRYVLVAAFILAMAPISGAPAAAQGAAPEVPAVSTGEQQVEEVEEGGLSVTVSADWQDLGIAITSFATDRDMPTRTNAGSTAALGRALGQVIADNLRNNGLFKPTGPGGLPQPTYAQVPAPDYPVWTMRRADMLVQGYVRAGPDGRLIIGCYLYDVALQQQLARAGWEVPPEDWRRAAHKSTPACPAKAHFSTAASPISPRPGPKTAG
jgi:TolB protein